MPAILDPAVTLHIQDLARQVYRVLWCAGMARVDFFYTPAGDIYINEVNTIPWFTDISMYPKLIGLTGLSYPQIIDRLIQSALVPHI
jgi:D-alanine-D-alanine ligase